MLMTPPPALGVSPLYSPTAINRQAVQQQAVPGLQSAPVLNRGTTGLGAMPQLGGGNSGTRSSGTGMNTAALVNLLGRG